MTTNQRVHLIVGAFPPGSHGGHDMDYARLKLLQALHAHEGITVTTANDFKDIERWLPGLDLLVTYVAGPFPTGAENDALQKWLEDGGRWFALHGTSGGKAVRMERDGRTVKTMVKGDHHKTLGCFFLNHPPITTFDVAVAGAHKLTQDLPKHFTVQDELYLVELQDPGHTSILMTTELEKDPSPPGFGFVFDKDTALQPDGKTRVLAYSRPVGKGEIVYMGLGHCHTGRDRNTSFVDKSIDPSGKMPPTFGGPWEDATFAKILDNGISWGLAA